MRGGECGLSKNLATKKSCKATEDFDDEGFFCLVVFGAALPAFWSG